MYEKLKREVFFLVCVVFYHQRNLSSISLDSLFLLLYVLY